MGRQSRLKQERRAERDRLADAAAGRAEARRVAAERGAAEGQRRGCLICRRSDGGFTAQEHIIPESLGNTTKVLPIGIVCDRCNNGVCASLDEALCNFAPIHLLRTMHRQPSKSGKLPSVAFDNGRLEATDPDNLSLSLSGSKWHQETAAPPGRKGFSFTAKRNDLTPERLSLVHRAFVKQALEFAWLDHGKEWVLGSDFDHERDLILHGGRRGYIAVPRKIEFGEAELRSGVHYGTVTRNEDGHPLMFLVARFWNVPFITDTLFAEPTRPLPADFAVWTF